MSSTTTPTAEPNRFGSRTLLLFAVPILLLAGVIALFAFTDGAGLNVEPAAPIESITFGRTILNPGEIELQIRNTSQQDVSISQKTSMMRSGHLRFPNRRFRASPGQHSRSVTHGSRRRHTRSHSSPRIRIPSPPPSMSRPKRLRPRVPPSGSSPWLDSTSG